MVELLFGFKWEELNGGRGEMSEMDEEGIDMLGSRKARMDWLGWAGFGLGLLRESGV